MAEPIARAHRQIAQAEHAVEDRLKMLASQLPDGDVVRDGAEQISEAAERHAQVAERLDRTADD